MKKFLLASLALGLAGITILYSRGKATVTPQPGITLNGAWQGSYDSPSDPTGKNFVIVFKAQGKLVVFDGDTLTGDKARGTYMIEGSVLYGNYQYVQDGPVTNIRAVLNATQDIVSGAWTCGTEGGSFVVDRNVTHSVALQPGSPLLP